MPTDSADLFGKMRMTAASGTPGLLRHQQSMLGDL
jgi:hypothetical protein